MFGTFSAVKGVFYLKLWKQKTKTKKHARSHAKQGVPRLTDGPKPTSTLLLARIFSMFLVSWIISSSSKTLNTSPMTVFTAAPPVLEKKPVVPVIRSRLALW